VRQLHVSKAFGEQQDDSNTREINIYFPPTRISSPTCLHINFSSTVYIGVKLAYASPSIYGSYREVQVFLTYYSWMTEFIAIEKTIEPEMVEFQEFVVVITVRQLGLGDSATFSNVQLAASECPSMQGD